MNLTKEQENRLDFDVMKARAILQSMSTLLSTGEDIDVVSLTDAALDYVNHAHEIMHTPSN